MLSEFQKRKLKRNFDIFDFDGNGVLTQDDYELIVDNLAKLRNYQQPSPEYEQLNSKIIGYWSELVKIAGTNNGEVTLSEWWDYCNAMMSTSYSYEKLIEPLSHINFWLIDTDSNEKITLAEYKQLAACCKFNTNEAAQAFTKLDLDGSGFIEKQELLRHLYDFFYSNNPEAPGNWILGPF
ncbi:MAG TPA: hypothetical protein DDZ80_30675 [Cyanobacteria bacterium UBA8803]|nr:hypothetical protein [Cyanobacteria bacterium UBA9273]HBL62591.1 hypothetical protein [Cyanobacteria bacterium UBA8803]